MRRVQTTTSCAVARRSSPFVLFARRRRQGPRRRESFLSLPAEGGDWVYELKFDGCRALVTKDGQRVELRSRKNKDLAGMYPGSRGGGPAVEGRRSANRGLQSPA